jgi:DUF2934 family protein
MVLKGVEAMAKAKSPRSTNSSSKQVITMPEAGSASAAKKNGSSISSPSNLSGNHSDTTDLNTQIRKRAYELYEERGAIPGYEHEDWLQAEREILARHNQQQTA